MGIAFSSKRTEVELGNTNWKGRSQSIVIVDGMIVYISHVKNSTRKLLQLIVTFCDVIGYNSKTCTQLATHLSINDKQTEKEIR